MAIRTPIGGTSAAAPLWAGFTALANQQAAANGEPTVGFINPAIYAIGRQAAAMRLAFHDITTGNNTNGSSPIEFLCRARLRSLHRLGQPGRAAT